MSAQSARKLESVDPSSTARIDRRQTVLAQIEAALLANKLTVLELTEENTGTDPYNRTHRGPAAGAAPRRR